MTISNHQPSTHSLVYLCTGDSVCLGYKKRGFGEKYWNGFGGKIEANETPVESAIREVNEESTVLTTAAQLEMVAVMQFDFPDDTAICCEVFIARSWQGEPVETEEMRPQWFLINALPYQDMWESDRGWLPRVLAGERLLGRIQFNETEQSVRTAHYQALG